MNSASEAHSVTVASLPVFLIVTVGAILLPLTLMHTLPTEGLSISNLFLLCFMPIMLYAMWVLTFEVVVQQTQIVVKRLFGLTKPIIIPSASIHEFRAKSNARGQLTQFEVIASGHRAVQLHMFQKNFLAAVAALRAYNPNILEREPGFWGF